jgi:hypothetical protein
LAERIAFARKARVAALVACALLLGRPHRLDAQSPAAVASAGNRDLAKACWYDANRGDCVRYVRAHWDLIVSTVLTAIQTPAAPRSTTPPGGASLRRRGGAVAAMRIQAPSAAVASPAGGSTAATVWDGTFAHPNAPSFYTLKGLVPADARTSDDVCPQLPDALKADRRLLLLLTCAADNELLAAGTDRWEAEHAEFQQLRSLVSACLPPVAANTDPCAAP